MKEVKRYTVANCWEKLGNETEVVAAADYDSLLRKFAEVERDAARYKLLRAGDIQKLNGLYVADAGNEWIGVDGAALDERLDSAMPGEG